MLEVVDMYEFVRTVFFHIGLYEAAFFWFDARYSHLLSLRMQKGFDKKLLDDPIRSGDLVASALVSAIANYDDAILEYSNRAARRSIESCCKNALANVSRNSQRVSLFPELIPGFAMLAFRFASDSIENDVSSVDVQDRNDAAASALIGSFVKGTGNRLISIKGVDVLMLIFPSEDMHKNLQELGVR